MQLRKARRVDGVGRPKFIPHRSCGDGLIASLKAKSGAEFEAFRACLADTNNAFDKCRAQKEALHAAFSAAR